MITRLGWHPDVWGQKASFVHLWKSSWGWCKALINCWWNAGPVWWHARSHFPSHTHTNTHTLFIFLYSPSLCLSLPLSPLRWALAGSWPRLSESQHVFTTLWMPATSRALPAIWMLCNINNWCSWGVVIKLVNYAGKITCNYETGGYV